VLLGVGVRELLRSGGVFGGLVGGELFSDDMLEIYWVRCFCIYMLR
jgi:hypothetical protein